MSTIAPTTFTVSQRKKVTTRTFREKKERGEPITMLTAYDYPTALAMDQAGVDSILVGDSLGMVVLGYENTLPVTMEEMLHHCRAVARGAKTALYWSAICRLCPTRFRSKRPCATPDASCNKANMDAVKLEGGRERVDAIRAIIGAGIPVMGHLGLTPQSVHQLGGFRAQGKTACRRQTPAGRRAAARRGGLLQPGARIRPGAAGGTGLAAHQHPHHRHRRGRGLRRAGAGHARPAGAVRPLHAQIRQEICGLPHSHAKCICQLPR